MRMNIRVVFIHIFQRMCVWMDMLKHEVAYLTHMSSSAPTKVKETYCVEMDTLFINNNNKTKNWIKENLFIMMSNFDLVSLTCLL